MKFIERLHLFYNRGMYGSCNILLHFAFPYPYLWS